MPSKALIRAARAAAAAREAGRFGVTGTDKAAVDFPAVMERMRRLRADISPNDSAERFRKLGVDVFIGDGKFASRDTVQVGDKTLHFARAVIASGEEHELLSRRSVILADDARVAPVMPGGEAAVIVRSRRRGSLSARLGLARVIHGSYLTANPEAATVRQPCRICVDFPCQTRRGA